MLNVFFLGFFFFQNENRFVVTH